MKDRDVEGQAGGGVVTFVPAAPEAQPVKVDKDTQGGVQGGGSSSGGVGPHERKRPGRLREKHARRPFPRFGELPEKAVPEDVDPRTRWQRAAAEARTVSRIESEEFFTHVWPEERHPVVSPTAHPTPTPGSSPEKLDIKTPSRLARKRNDKDREEEVIEESDSERAALVGAGGTGAVTCLVPAHYLPLHQRRAADHDTLFLPSALPSDVQSKVEGGEEALRDPGEEGLYIGEKPYLTRTNLNIIENRLLKQGDRQWFTETGSVERLDVPTSEHLHHHRPPLDPDPSSPLTVFVQPQTREQLLEGAGGDEATGVLDLELSCLTFHHHPLFSLEHVLAARLLSAHTTYTERVEVGVTRVLQNKLEVLRQAKAKLVRKAEKSSSGRGDKSVQAEIDRTRRLEIYRQETRECREEARVEAERDRELLSSILKTWSEMKQLRRANRYHSTPLKLLIQKVEVDRAEEEERRKVLLEAEVREVLEEREEEYATKRKNYEEEMEAWKEEHRKRKEAKKRQAERRRNSSSEISVLQAAQDESTLATPELPRPHPPPTIHRHKVELEVLDAFSRSHRPPGEPLITRLELTQLGSNSTPSITPINSCPDVEKKRRQTVGKTKVFVRILINNKLVTQTSATHLDGTTFSASLGQTYRMALSSWPRSVALELCEAGPGLRQATLATALLPIPACHVTIAGREEAEVVEYSGSQLVGCGSGGVGCGQAGSEYGHDLTSGKMTYRLGWATGPDGSTPLAPPGPMPSDHDQAKTQSRLDPACDPGSAQRWLDSARLDPNDPTNALLISRLKRAAAGRNITPRYLELDWHEGDFCSERDLAEGVRLRVLQLRAQGTPGFRALRMVPAAESEVLRKTLENYDSKALSEDPPGASEGDGVGEGGGEWWGQLEARRDRAERLLSSLRLRLHLRQADPSAAPPCLEDMVKEESIPDIGTLGTNLLGVFRARRPLKPPRRKRDRVRGAALTNQPVRLLVYIARAFHLPTRMPAEDTGLFEVVESGGLESEGGEVRPYVEGSFQRTIARTSLAHGPNPTWNQQLSFPFRAPNDNFSAGSLQTVPDSLHLHLYDETTSDLLSDDRLRLSTVHARVERRWLGSLHIPFSTIYANAKIEGTFALEEPAVLLGYTREGEATHRSTSPFSHRPHPPSPAHRHPPTTHLSVYITLEPTLPPPEPVQAHFESSEPEETIEAGRLYVTSLSARHPTRHYRTHALDLSGRLVALNRFIRPLQPPQELMCEDEDETMHHVAWYVSLVSTLAHTSLLPGPAHIWANSEQFLSLLTGGEEERAVLLTNFFLHLGKTAYLLLGSGVAEGGSCCVVTRAGKGSGEWQVWNPPTARCYNPRHPHPPLTAVHMLVDQDNMYANVQKYDDPPRVNLDVGGSGWRAFYPKSPHTLPHSGLPSVQPRDLTLAPADPEGVGRLRERLEVVLRDAFMKWRTDRRTVWNRHAVGVLRGLVGSLEEPRAAGHLTTSTPHLSNLTHLASLMDSHKVCGVCVHQGYSGAGSLVEAVHSTGIHLTHHPDVEFALALHIHSYPAAVASVWVYVASLVKRV